MLRAELAAKAGGLRAAALAAAVVELLAELVAAAQARCGCKLVWHQMENIDGQTLLSTLKKERAGRDHPEHFFSSSGDVLEMNSGKFGEVVKIVGDHL